MSEIKVSKLTNRSGTGAPDFSQGVKIEGTASTFLAPKRTESATEPTSPANGDTWYDTDNDVYDIYINDEWKRFIGEGGGSAVWYGDRGIEAGGQRGATKYNIIDYVDITTTGNSTDFGDLTETRSYPVGFSDGTYGVISGGFNSSNQKTVTIDYVTVATTGNATDFGDTTLARHDSGGTSDATRGLTAGGDQASGTDNTVDYVTIATPGNATDFGDLLYAGRGMRGCSDGTYGVFFGNGGSNNEGIEYFTIQTTGNGTDFGDATSGGYAGAAAGDGTYGLYAGRYSNQNVIDYVTVATPGNATDFGDLTYGRWGCGGMHNATRMVITTGYQKYYMDYVEMATTGNATDFGDTTENRYVSATTSGAAS